MTVCTWMDSVGFFAVRPIPKKLFQVAGEIRIERRAVVQVGKIPEITGKRT